MIAAWMGCTFGEGPLAPVTASRLPIEEGSRGRLAWRAAFELDANDAAWGGWSGAALDGDVLWAVSDVGDFLSLRLAHDESGRLIAVTPERRGSLRDLSGQPLVGKRNADAEGLARLPTGFLVSFERNHRLLQYTSIGDASTAEVSLPNEFAASSNGGLEALAWARDQLWIALEGDEDETGPHRGWHGEPGRWIPFSFPRADGYRPVEWTPLPDGDLLLIERSFTKSTGLRVRISRLATEAVGPQAAPAELGTLTPPDPPMDNYEAAATDGRFVYLLADDNQSADQRTLLLQVEVLP